jgi:tetratricopeptide (TPR) repeat protein
VDSNLDWGQDLKRLKKFIDEKKIGSIYLSYFGTANPCYYGISFIFLPGSPANCLGITAPRTADYIAISATNLHSVYLPVRSYEWLEMQSPVAQVGYSIFIYDVRKNPIAHNELGILFLKYQRFQEAVAEFKWATKAAPDASTVYLNLGVAYSFLADFPKAENAFRKALELDPYNETAKKGLAVIAEQS